MKANLAAEKDTLLPPPRQTRLECLLGFLNLFCFVWGGVSAQFSLLAVMVIQLLAECLLPRMYLIAGICYRLLNHWGEILCLPPGKKSW